MRRPALNATVFISVIAASGVPVARQLGVRSMGEAAGGRRDDGWTGEH